MSPTPSSGPRRLLVLNPNTSTQVTELLVRHIAPRLPPGLTLAPVTARLGASYIASEASYAIAGHAALDAWAVHSAAEGEPDAVLVGCFGDPGCFALRELSAGPVLGLAEAAMQVAARHGRFRIVTGGAAWAPMLERLARALSLDAALAGVQTVAPSGAELAADPAAAVALLATACRDAADGVDAVILGGAGLAGMAAQVQPQVPVPVIDSVIAGVDEILQALALADARAASSVGEAAPDAARHQRQAPAAAPQWSGLSPDLAERLGRP